MGARCLLGPWRRKQPPLPPLLVWGLLAILIIVNCLVDTASAGSGSCMIQECHDLYVVSEAALEIEVDELQYMKPTSIEVQHKVCVILRTYSKCLNATASMCRSDLQFHSMHTGATEKLRRNRCPADGDIFDARSYTPQPKQDPCEYKGPAGYRHCGLFGDPHLRTFNNEFQTCRVQGAWPLVENKYLTVQVTNDPVGEWERMATATATSKVTVVVKSFSKCGVEEFVTYQALSGHLPSTFDDGRTYLGADERHRASATVSIATLEHNRHVELHLRYIDTLVVIRQIGVYFNVAVRMPEELVRDDMVRNLDSLDLCQKGCPRKEIIDYKAILSYKTTRLKRLASHERTETPEYNMDIGRAQARCRRAGLVDFYFDSCVFDLVTTGDVNFTGAAEYALQDLVALYPEGVLLHTNRTTLERVPVNSAATRTLAYSSNTSFFHTLHHRTTTLVTIATTLLLLMASHLL